MASPTIDRRLGLTGDKGMKAPVDVASLANITLSGEQTVDGVLTSTSRVLVKNQTDATTNGLYDSSSAAWTRCIDANGYADLVKGTLVQVTGGSQAQTFWSITSSNPLTVGTSAITWGVSLTAAISTLSFIASGTGGVTRSALVKMREVISADDFNGTRGTDWWGLGTGAMVSTTTAVDSMGFGTNALTAMTTGFGNTAFGKNALKTLTTPAYCSAFGAYALESADLTGNVNLICTAVGAYALNANTNGQYNTTIGGYAGQNTTTGYFGTFIGMKAGRANTIGFSNTFVGHSAGEVLTGASNFNTFCGESAGVLTTATIGSCLFGYNAGTNNVTGTYLHAFGYAAASSSLAGLGTTFGKQAAYSVISNTGWVAMGYEAGISALGGNWTAVGHQAMGGANNGGSGTAVGYRAGYANAGAYDNVIALGSNSTNTRSNQCVVGDSSLTEIRTSAYVVQKLAVTGSTLLDNNGEFAFFVVDNTHVNFKYKGSDGTVRTATGAFSGGFTLA